MGKELAYKELEQQNIGKIHISFSEFSKYQTCGHRHLLEKYLKIAPEPTSIHLIFGNSVHQAIEYGIKDNLNVENRVKVFKEDFTNQMLNNLKESEEFNEFENFLKQGEEIIKKLSTEKILEKYKIIGVELPIYEKLHENYFFKGFIDLIVQDKKTQRYVIMDWKTSGEAWDISKKKKDSTFMSQMRFYKYFISKKLNIDFENIDCKYIVLNRLISKKFPDLGFGEIQPVEIYSNESEIEESLSKLGETVKNIHILNYFPKIKFVNDSKSACYFCPFKNNYSLCDSDPNQYVRFLNQEA